jgi:hypothetical protein
MKRANAISGMLAAAALLALCAPAALAEDTSVTDWLGALPAQFAPPADAKSGSGGGSGLMDGKLHISAGFALISYGRDAKTTHVSGRPRSAATFFQHTQADQDSSWYMVHRIGALKFTGDYALNEQITLHAALMLGGNASIVEYRVGTGNTYVWSPADYSATIDTKVGWYPLDMFYGIALGGDFAIGDLHVGGRWTTHIASAYFDTAIMPYGFVNGYVTIFTNDIDAIASYRTDFGTPSIGMGLSIYECWSHQETEAAVPAVDYKFHYREEQWFSVLAGYRLELEEGHYFAVEIYLVSKWSLQFEVGYKFM